jgi:ABC-2 type transport system permease protein
MTTFRALFLAELRLLLRDRAQLFFTLVFPLLFILIFGFLMADIGELTARLGLHVAAGADAEALESVLEDSGARSIERFERPAELREAVNAQDVDFGVEWNGETLRFVYNANRVSENTTYRQIAAAAKNAFELRGQGVEPVLAVSLDDVGEREELGWFNVMVPGIIAFSILSAGLFAVSGHLTSMKERGALTRLLVTPMPPVALLGSIALVRTLVVFLSTLITLFIAWFAFDLYFEVAWTRYVPLVIASTMGMMGLGTIIALVVRRASSAANAANILAMVMLFLSGIYFPIEFLPGALRAFSQVLPLRHMAEAMRFATGVQSMSVQRFWITVGALAALGIVLFPILARYVVRGDRR